MSEKSKRIVWRSVKSANPAKPAIMAAIRAAAGVTGGKVTTVKVSKDGTQVSGHVLTRPPGARGFTSQGTVICPHPG